MKDGGWSFRVDRSSERGTCARTLERHRHRRARRSARWQLAILGALSLPASRRTKFYRDDPIQVEPETQDASRVTPWKIDLFYDLMLNQFTRPGLPPGNRAATSIPSMKCRIRAGSPTAS